MYYQEISLINYQLRSTVQQMIIKILFILLALASLFLQTLFTDNASKGGIQFKDYCKKYGKSYMDAQIYYREQIFNRNLEYINKHNQNKSSSYKLEVNSFADLTLEQFKLSYLGVTVSKKQSSKIVQDQQLHYQVQIDWQKDGKVTPVKNQKMCASCWAFCSIAALQSAYLIQKGMNLSFSQQQLVDCSTPYGNKGCQGGQLQYTFHYIQDKGVNLESTYPYVAKNQNCKKTRGPYKMTNYRRQLTCGGLYSGLLKGPVTVAVDALFWGFYKEGIYDNCGNEVNHGVLVVGAYEDYWLVKNSWGIQWGDNGYIRVKRGNTCSICEYPYVPLL